MTGADRPINLLLLFTCGVSLETWKRQGLMDREIRYYQIMQDAGLGDVRLLTYGTDDAALAGEIAPIGVLPRPRLLGIRAYSLVAPLLRLHAFAAADIVKSNQSYGAWTGVVAKVMRRSTKLVVRCGFVRNDDMMTRDEGLTGIRLRCAKFVERISFRCADAVIVTSSADKHFVQTAYRVDPGRVWTVPNAVDTGAFTFAARNGCLSTPLHVMAVGRMVPMKNFQSVIVAARMLGRPVTLTLIGDGAHRPALEALAREQGVRTTFVRAVPNAELPARLQTADVFVMPQLFGAGMSKVILEAMASGVLTVASDIGAHREVLTDGVNGFLCQPDAASLAACLERVVAASDAERQAVTERARADVVQKYAMDVNARREVGIYRTLLGQGHAEMPH